MPTHRSGSYSTFVHGFASLSGLKKGWSHSSFMITAFESITSWIFDKAESENEWAFLETHYNVEELAEWRSRSGWGHGATPLNVTRHHSTRFGFDVKPVYWVARLPEGFPRWTNRCLHPFLSSLPASFLSDTYAPGWWTTRSMAWVNARRTRHH